MAFTFGIFITLQRYFACATSNIYGSWFSGQTILSYSLKICIFIAVNVWFSQGFNINGILKKIISVSNDFVKLNLWGLTLCPFSPGSPGSPSKPLSPCTDTQWGGHPTPTWAHINVSTHRVMLCENNSLFAGCAMAYATLDPGSPGIPRAPSAPERPWGTLHMQIMTYML